MGQRTSSETLAAIIGAFWKQHTWKQAELAQQLGLSVRSVRKHLEDLASGGWPFERQEDPPHVYWSVPKKWFPGGVLLTADHVGALVHLLVRTPPSAERAALLRAVMEVAPSVVSSAMDRVVPPRTSDVEERLLPTLLDALARRSALRLRYFTASRGSLSTRHVSVQRVFVGPPTRFVAYCHRAKALRWFRLDYATAVVADADTAYVDVPEDDVETLLTSSVDGFGGDEVVRVAFFVREPEAHWVAWNLPDGLLAESVRGGLLVEAETAGLLPIARFVVGLGEAAEPRTPELTRLVAQLASGALKRAAGKTAGESSEQ